MRMNISIEETIELLNGALEADRVAISALVEQRVPCNSTLADHPTIQVGIVGSEKYAVGMLGILNGLFGADKTGWGCIAAVYDEGSKTILRFEKRL